MLLAARLKESGERKLQRKRGAAGQFNVGMLQLRNAVYNQQRINRWNEGCIHPFPKKGDLGLTSNYRGITLTAIAAKIYSLLLFNRI